MAISDEHRALIEKLKPVDVPEIPCLDCEPHIDGLRITHAALCPVAMCIDDVTAADRAWFEAHPFADFYHRSVTWGEGANLIVLNPDMVKLSESHHLAVQGRVRVERIRDDARIRKFDEVWFLVVPRPGADAERLPAATSPPSMTRSDTELTENL
ncbi:hypothetical protein ACIPV2_00175 [Microbacterium sp. NPDC089987]|uniref:hypothetical protein n=1 Tax=Microbacterium sp. NPDC089987 TaxID=3364202 RepID=UPI00381882A9